MKIIEEKNYLTEAFDRMICMFTTKRYFLLFRLSNIEEIGNNILIKGENCKYIILPDYAYTNRATNHSTYIR